MDRKLWLIDFGGVIKFCCNCRDVIKCDSPTYFYFVRSCFCKNTAVKMLRMWFERGECDFGAFRMKMFS